MMEHKDGHEMSGSNGGIDNPLVQLHQEESMLEMNQNPDLAAGKSSFSASKDTSTNVYVINEATNGNGQQIQLQQSHLAGKSNNEGVKS